MVVPPDPGAARRSGGARALRRGPGPDRSGWRSRRDRRSARAHAAAAGHGRRAGAGLARGRAGPALQRHSGGLRAAHHASGHPGRGRVRRRRRGRPCRPAGPSRDDARPPDEGTGSRTANELAEEQERLGATIGAGAGLDRSSVSLAALTPNLGPSLDLLADVVRNPGFKPQDIERLRGQQLAAIASELTQPNGLAGRALPPLLYGPDHPYGRPGGSGDPDAVRAITREDILAFHRSWVRPDNATIFAVGDLPLAQLTAQLEARFGNWRAPDAPRGTKSFAAAVPQPQPRIVLIDRPQSPQSLIVGAQLLDANGRQDLLALSAANDVVAGDFMARLNMELRERRGWSYGVRGGPGLREHQIAYTVQAPVQADKTGESIAALRDLMGAFLTTSGTQAGELERVVQGSTRELPGQFQTSNALLGSMMSNALHARPDDYWETIADRYRGLSADELDREARRLIDPDRFVWVVVGDAAVVRPQLAALGLPIEDLRIE
ncbi:M16 family metallopeptidase [Croceibacterium soli]|uniref:M16 family metallopeptidase n=1 Tax=Croceibacterium soli TaxID=1739690 RepID=UPI002E273E22